MAMTATAGDFVVCICNADVGDLSRADLTVGKCYEMLSVENGWLRLIDDSGEDYLYPPSLFEPVALSPDASARLKASLAGTR